MLDCPVIWRDGAWHCPVCEVPLKGGTANKRPARNCVASPDVAPNERSVEEREALATLCRSNACGAFDPVNDACRLVGCTSVRHLCWLALLRRGDCPRGVWSASR